MASIPGAGRGREFWVQRVPGLRDELPSATPAGRGSVPISREPIRPEYPIPTRDIHDGPVTKGVPLKEGLPTTNAAMAAGLTRGISDLSIPKDEKRKRDDPPLRTTSDAAPNRTPDDVTRRATELGAIGPSLEQLPGGEWQFSCMVPNPRNANVHRRYEARDRDKATAVRLVVEQIERDRKE